MDKKKEMIIEEKHLEELRSWLQMYINKQINEKDKIEKKIASMKKSSKGSYSYELETTEKLYAVLKKNVSEYIESQSQPFFARIDFREYKKDKEIIYIGKSSLGDWETGDEMVIDWRSPIADLYYSGTEGNVYYKAPKGIIDGELSLKRKFLFNDGMIEDIFDEGINEIIINHNDENGDSLTDEFLRINLEKSSGTKLKDIVATIQKEQNEIIRWTKNSPIIVQGAAGSGKTTVALHRLAYLLYRYKDSIAGENILVLAPNSLFLDYISDVLPDLGVEGVNQSTVESFMMKIIGGRYKTSTKDDKLLKIQKADEQLRNLLMEESRFKGSLKYKDMIDTFLRVLEIKDSKVEDIKIDSWVLFRKDEIQRLFLEDMKSLCIDKRKEEIRKYLSKKLKTSISGVCGKIDIYYEMAVRRCKKEMEDCDDRRKKLIQIYDERDEKKQYVIKNAKSILEKYFSDWMNKDTKDLYRRFIELDNDYHELVIDEHERDLWNDIKKNTLEVLDSGCIDDDDCAAMAYIKLKVNGIPKMKEIKHTVIDEAQDYSPFQLYVISMMTSNKSMTIVGDIGQGIYYYRGINSWENLIREVFDDSCTYKTLSQSYRSTIEILEESNKVLRKQNLSIKPTKPVLRHGNKPEVLKIDTDAEFIDKVNDIADLIINDKRNTIAIVCRNLEECAVAEKKLKSKKSKYKWKIIKGNEKSIKDDFIIIPAYLTKGLEFDCTIIYNCSKDNYTDNEFDKKLLYVVMTRALHYEFIMYREDLSNLIE